MQRVFARLVAFASCLALCATACPAILPSPAQAAPAAPPTLTVPGAQTVNEGVFLAFGVSATDPDGGTAQLRASGVPAGATFRDNQNNTGSFSWTPDLFQAGSYLVTFTADDTFGGVDTRSVSIDVLNVNNAPVLDPIGDRSVERGGFLSVWVSGSDPDGDALSFSQTSMPSFGSLSDFGDGNASLTFAPPADEPPSTTSMTITLSDGQIPTSETFSITVFAIGNSNPPSLATIGDQTLAEGELSSVAVSATDADNDVMSWTVSLPGFASLVPTGSAPGSATARLDLAPGFCAAGSYPASIAVSDGSLSAAESFTVNVTDVIRAPAWSVPLGGYTLLMDEGSAADLPVVASDPDQECGTPAPTLSFLGAGAPPSLSVTFTDQGGGSGLLHVVAGFGAAGSHQLTLRARDAMNSSLAVDITVQVTVQNVNRAPVASAGGPYAGLVGAAVDMSAAGSSDPDGDALSYAWTFGDGMEGTGVAVSHVYGAAGHYVVGLTVGDGALSSAASTTADVSASYQARAFLEPGSVKLFTGKPRHSVYLEPVAETFDLASVDRESIKLSAPGGMGDVPFIRPLADKTTLGEDRDRNGIAEMRLDFAKEDLRSLLSRVVQKSVVTLTLSANLLGGGSVEATVGAEVWPERKGPVQRVYPNPMNPEATITLSTESAGFLRMHVFDLNGRLVRTVLDEPNLPAGLHDVRFDGRDGSGRPLPSGLYYYRVETPSERTSGSLTILK